MYRVWNLTVKLSLVVLSPLFVFGLAELVLAAFYPQLERIPVGLFQRSKVLGGATVQTPNFVGVHFKPEFGEVEVRTNSYGLRDHREYNYTLKQDGVFCILALGDSFTWGLGVKYEDTYLRRLEKLLNDNKSREQFEIVKAGIPGYGTREELAYLKQFGLRLKPDLVLLGFIAEDMMNNGSSLSAVPSEINSSIRTFPTWNVFKARSYEQLEWRLRHSSHLYNLLVPFVSEGLLLRGFVEKKAEDSFMLRSYPRKWQELWNMTESLLWEMHEVLSAANIPLVIVVIPQRIQIMAHQLKIDADRFDPEKPARLIKEFGDRYGVVSLNLLPRFQEAAQKSELYFPVDGHPNAIGARVLANELDLFLRQIPAVKTHLDSWETLTVMKETQR